MSPCYSPVPHRNLKAINTTLKLPLERNWKLVRIFYMGKHKRGRVHSGSVEVFKQSSSAAPCRAERIAVILPDHNQIMS